MAREPYTTFDLVSGAIHTTGYNFHVVDLPGSHGVLENEMGDEVNQYVADPAGVPHLVTKPAQTCTIDQIVIEAKPGNPADTEAEIINITNPTTYEVFGPLTYEAGTVTSGILIFDSTVDGFFTIQLTNDTELQKEFIVEVTP